MTTPYVYLIGWTKLDTWYCGVRYRKGCAPSDLWTLYFTSSKYVKQFRDEHGEPDHVEVIKTFDESTKEDARLFEQEYLTERDVIHKDNWLNRAIGGHFAGTRGPMSEETKLKISKATKGKSRKPITEEQKSKQKATFKKNYSFDRHSAMTSGGTRSNETKRKISETLTGSTMNEATKSKIGATMAKKRWFNDGEKSVFREECPAGFSTGRLPLGPR